MKVLTSTILLLGLASAGCHCRHAQRCDTSKPFNFHPELDEVGPNGGRTVREELASVAGQACAVKSDEELWCTRCRDYFETWVTATHCADRMLPQFCSAACSAAPRSDCVDEPGRTLVRRRCLKESFPGFLRAVPCCGGLDLDTNDERLVLKGSKVQACK